MSYWIELRSEGKHLGLREPHQEGGIISIPAESSPILNVTYNYCRFYYDTIDAEDGIQWLRGKKAIDTVEKLAKAIATLGYHRSDDYWEVSSGNAGYALKILLNFAFEFPDAIWFVD